MRLVQMKERELSVNRLLYSLEGCVMSRAEVSSAIVSASYSAETGVAVLVTEKGDVYYCDGNGFANKKSVKCKNITMRGMQVKEGEVGCAW